MVEEAWLCPEDRSVLPGIEYTYFLAANDGNQETFAPKNRATAIENVGVPPGDFTSDGVVGVNDLGRLASTYAVDSTSAEFDPVFDLNHDGRIYAEDFVLLRANFGTGGWPATSPPGENTNVRVEYDVGVGYNVRVEYDVPLEPRRVASDPGTRFQARSVWPPLAPARVFALMFARAFGT